MARNRSKMTVPSKGEVKAQLAKAELAIKAALAALDGGDKDEAIATLVGYESLPEKTSDTTVTDESDAVVVN